jgi:hypothetical protein
VNKFPAYSPFGRSNVYLTTKDATQMIETHYSRCVEKDSMIGRLVSVYVLKSGLVKEEEFVTLAEKYPHLLGDVFWTARKNGGSLW